MFGSPEDLGYVGIGHRNGWLSRSTPTEGKRYRSRQHCKRALNRSRLESNLALVVEKAVV